VKVQYFGDVNDYRKFALLRLLADKFKIGVCWMLTEADGSGRGQGWLPQATGSLARLRPSVVRRAGEGAGAAPAVGPAAS
jgi:hypothetical protein